MAFVIPKNAYKDSRGVFHCDVELSKLHIDQSYQRDEVKKHKIGREGTFKQGHAQPLVLSYRDGVLYIVDGYQRHSALKAHGILTHAASIYVNLSLKEEADMFYDLNECPAKLGPWFKFNAARKAGRIVALKLAELLTKYNLTWPTREVKEKDAHYVNVQPLYYADSLNVADSFLYVLSKAFRVLGLDPKRPMQKATRNHEFLRGLARSLVGKTSTEVRNIADILCGITPEQLNKEANALVKVGEKKASVSHFAEAIAAHCPNTLVSIKGAANDCRRKAS